MIFVCYVKVIKDVVICPHLQNPMPLVCKWHVYPLFFLGGEKAQSSMISSLTILIEVPFLIKNMIKWLTAFYFEVFLGGVDIP